VVFAERKEKLSDDGHIIPNKVGCVNTFIKKNRNVLRCGIKSYDYLPTR